MLKITATILESSATDPLLAIPTIPNPRRRKARRTKPKAAPVGNTMKV
jgi:hypothetical protein